MGLGFEFVFAESKWLGAKKLREKLGMTETGGLATLGYPDEMCMLGAVGSAFVYTDLRLEEVPDMDCDPLADPP
ncbi:AMP-binding, conserved site-containing protein [Artemisia annua]|uniref:AMP-binding, conserved site-containing protein n=1 Tax=Artemisia annua TaxID=35608 RepID=A0A2U1LQT4_ARTAN|nr:AMP-binding, conserved site-containing protein [Artemisia annua]